MAALPNWTRSWSRRYELATLAESVCQDAIEKQLEAWLAEVEQRDGPAKPETN